jgi:hypothetical protein
MVRNGMGPYHLVLLDISFFLKLRTRNEALKGDGTSVAVLHLYDSFHQKCSKLGTVTTLGLKNKGRE